MEDNYNKEGTSKVNKNSKFNKPYARVVKSNFFNVEKKGNAGCTKASSPIKVEDDDTDGDGIPEKYKNNLQSNAHINAFKYPNTFSNDTTKKEAAYTKRFSTNWIQSFNESRIFDSKTLAKRSNNNTYIKPYLKRRLPSDDNQWESVFINFKKRIPAENEFQHRQMELIQNLSEDRNKFNSSMGSNMGGNEGVMATRSNKAHRFRFRIVSPYSRANNPSKGIFILELAFFITKYHFQVDILWKDSTKHMF